MAPYAFLSIDALVRIDLHALLRNRLCFFYGLIAHTLRQRLDSQLSGKISEFEAIFNLQGLQEVKSAVLIESQAAGEKKIFFRLLYPSGVAFSSSNMSYWQTIGINRAAVRRLVEGRAVRVYETLTIPGRPDRVRIAYGIIGRGVVAQLGYSMESDTTFIAIFKKIFFNHVRTDCNGIGSRLVHGPARAFRG
ncbi:hypothetical protein [Desulfosarcina cetonica]|uniref:hypothetical protein n=1 Tax=Desulfosarcina cetonica TaxID=90730 RepID=UPI0006CFBDDB|nr:hypothetical protein [Desulfosarcina cetonica]